jgi:hypothetical protein
MQIMGESHPWMAVFLPHRECRLLEIPVSKTANRNSVNIRNHVEFPKHCAAAIWAKMLADFAIIQSVADIDLPGVPDFYLWPFIISANSKHRTRPALTLSAVAGQNKRRFARNLNAQSAATTVSSPGHDCGPSPASLRSAGVNEVKGFRTGIHLSSEIFQVTRNLMAVRSM